MPAPTLTVGAITIIPLSDGGFSVPIRGFFPELAEEIIEAEKALLGADETISINVGSFLIREGESLSIVDTGVGGRGESPGTLMDELHKAGVAPEQITRVIMTHSHFDHVGWNTVDRDGKAEVVFKNARYILQRKDWDTRAEIPYTVTAKATCLDPLEQSGHLELIDGDVSLTAGIAAWHTPGHTPGHQSILISSQGEKAIITGDVMHTPVQINHPELSPGADSDPAQAARTRAALIERIEQEGLKVCAGHYPYPGLGTVIRVDNRRVWRAV